MEFALLDMLIIFCLVQLIGLFTIILINRQNNTSRQFLLGFFIFSFIMNLFNYLIFRFYDVVVSVTPHLFYIGMPFTLAWAPTIYLYTRTYTNPEFHLRKREILHYIPLIIYFGYFAFNYYFFDATTKRMILEADNIMNYHQRLFKVIAIHAQMFPYLGFCLYEIKKYRTAIKKSYSSIHKMNLSWLTIMIVSLLIVFSFMLMRDTLEYTGHRSFKHVEILLFILFLIFCYQMTYKGIKFSYVLVGNILGEKYQKSTLKKEDYTRYVQILSSIMQQEHPYLDPDISLNELSKRVGILPTHLSQLINDNYNQNFFDFINGFRIKAAIKRLIDPEEKQTILAILLDVGFNSKTAFNRAFKKKTGTTPSHYRKQYLSTN